MTARRIGMVAALVMTATVLTAQSAFSERTLQALGLNSEEIRQVRVIHQNTDTAIRRLEADLAVKKAELARILMDESPNMRQVERNLRESAAIEVDIRLAEIRREIAVRDSLGTDRWARMVRMLQTLRTTQQEVAGEIGTEMSRRMRDLHATIDQKQRALAELMQNRRDLAGSQEIRDAFRELQEQYLELQQVIREQF